MIKNKTYWKSTEQLKDRNTIVDKLKQNEFAEKLPIENNMEFNSILEDSSSSRRDFLKYVGFSTAAATIAACEGPVIKSIPYVDQPEQIRPGVSNYYATSIADGFDFANILIKTREGRPIKVESNNDSPFFGSANARVHASILSMYDTKRVQGPIKNNQSNISDESNQKNISWEDLNGEVIAKLDKLLEEKRKVILLTQTFASPTTSKIIDDFVKKYPNVNHVIYDTVSSSSAIEAYYNTFGFSGMADYDFSKSDFIVSVGADFLGDWQGGGYDLGYARKRIPNKKSGKALMSKHYQFESNMSLTGANADVRVPCNSSEQKAILAYIYNSIFQTDMDIPLNNSIRKYADEIIVSLKENGKNSVIVSGIEDVYAQELVLAINSKIKSKAIDVFSPRLIRQGRSKLLKESIEQIKRGSVGGLINVGVDPVYSLYDGEEFANAIKKMEFSVSFSMKVDETSSVCEFIAPTPHYLESWGDYEFKKGYFSLAQPTIRPLFDTNQFQDILLKWSGIDKTYYDSIKEKWKNDILESESWNKVLHDGYLIKNDKKNIIFVEALSSKNDKNQSNKLKNFSSNDNKGLELVLYTKTGIGDGKQANNPWLQEFPDPITRASWDNYLTMSLSDANTLGIKNVNVANGALNGSYANLVSDNISLKVPVIIQPGQAKGTFGLALGYGKIKGLQKEMQVGVNAYKFYKDFNPIQRVSISLADGFHEFACIQLHNTLMGRGDIIKETTLEIFNTKDKKYWNSIPVVSKNHIEEYVTSSKVDMYEEFDQSIGHHFNLSIDLNSCTGCGACVIACHAENNVPVVGKREVRKSRDMHWLRIDRYYSSEETFKKDEDKKNEIDGLSDTLFTLRKLEKASENPQVAFQPVMCQHCNQAPCETVCPVAATSHGRQGQNHMAYNRCVGTRYCANNCPYKVRRFNWFLYNNNDEFDFHMNNDLGRMVLNPDVVVRSRGVMEKCSFCIQMTQKTILDAKLEGRKIKDSDWNCACSNACSSGAMVFGDVNDKESEVSKLKDNERMYHLLESVGTKPNVMYQLKVRNT